MLTCPKVISFLKLRGSYAESKSGGTSPEFSANVNGTPASGYGYYWPSPYGGPSAPSYPFSQPYTLAPTYSSQSSATFTDQTVNSNITTEGRQATELGGNIRFFTTGLKSM
ncbi:MAG: hypothetical protein WDM78_05085 [Puia sp.]